MAGNISEDVVRRKDDADDVEGEVIWATTFYVGLMTRAKSGMS
jgi:hypothetical protein